MHGPTSSTRNAPPPRDRAEEHPNVNRVSSILPVSNSEIPLDPPRGSVIALDSLPLPTKGETVAQSRWFEEEFFKRVAVRQLLAIATLARNENHECRFGERVAGGYNVVIFLIFDDGVEWVAKIPIRARDNDDENEKVMSEFATLQFLQQIGTVPAPKIRGFAFDRNNPTKTPYLLMDKVPGISLYQAIEEGLSRDCVYQTLRQLAQIRKDLTRYKFHEIGSLTVIDNETCEVGVDRLLTVWNFFDYLEPYKSRSGPFETSLAYYANLYHTSWSEYQAVYREIGVRERWNIHAYLGSVLSSYVGDETGEFFLAHTDLDGQNILVDRNGSITGIIDWEFANTLPFRAAEHYPLLLSLKDEFVELLKDVYENPLAELETWRRIYAEQFVGDSPMIEYLNNIDEIIAFESILRDNDKATLNNLVTVFRFLQTPGALDQVVGLPFPWTGATKPQRPN